MGQGHLCTWTFLQRPSGVQRSQQVCSKRKKCFQAGKLRHVQYDEAQRIVVKILLKNKTERRIKKVARGRISRVYAGITD